MSTTPFAPDDPDGMADEQRDPFTVAFPEASGEPSRESGDHPADSLNELALRRLLHQAVEEVQPSPDALERLRRAVPARRVRRRQAMVGAAAGVLLVGTAVPALVHAADAGGPAGTHAAETAGSFPRGSSPGAYGGAGQGGATAGGVGRAVSGTPRPGGGGPGGASPSAGAPGGVPGHSQAPTATMAATSPTCARTQLGKATAQTEAPEQSGRVRGSFRVVNISATTCSVPGGDQLTVAAQGSTDISRIQVVDHTTGDPATALPDPATAPDAVTLPPGKAYQVLFEWIPADGGGTTGCATSTSPPPAGAGGTTGTGGNTATDSSAGSPGTAGDGGSPSTAPASGGITLSDVPGAGPPAIVGTSISGACAGTVYRTAALASP